MACEEHPSYGGLRKPRGNCKGCHAFYEVNKKQGVKGTRVINGKTNSEEQSTPKKDRKRASESAKPKRAGDGKAKGSIPADNNPKEQAPRRKPAKPVAKSTERVDGKVEKSTTKAPTEKVSPVVPVVVPQDLIADAKAAVDKVFEEIFERRVLEIKNRLIQELTLEYDHLFLDDMYWRPQLMKMLESEGWQWMSHSWPLADKGIIARDYTVLKRVKKSDNKPVPEFSDPKVAKAYGVVIKNTKAKK